MKPRPVGKSFLREARVDPEAAEPRAESRLERGEVAGAGRHGAPTLGIQQTMCLQTMSSANQSQTHVPESVSVKRSDPIYNAHSYLTKVPVAAIEPFILAFTEPGDTVLDLFAGSGLAGVAAAIHGRSAVLRDISVLGRHIGSNYLNLVDRAELRRVGMAAVAESSTRVGPVYEVPCARCNQPGVLSRTVWTMVYECPGCKRGINFYRALEKAEWSKRAMRCSHCSEPFAARNARRIGEEPVFDTVACGCAPKLMDQAHYEPSHPSFDGLTLPDVPIEETRQMFQASALARNNLRSTSAFFSPRNLAALAALWESINQVSPKELRDKLRFAFTAILTRASKRYQWSRKRPLNAANANYYVAPVFYEWNVYDLFERKLEAVARSDDVIRERMAAHGVMEKPKVEYQLGSAEELPLGEESIDYVFTDPPFGSNIFYSDMSLFQEAWLGQLTEHSREAVVDRTRNGNSVRTAERYEELIANALRECHRVLKPGGWLSLVFSNSSGKMWGVVQRAVEAAGFVLDPDAITVLDKGQRSVKGLASGFENVVTADLVFSMQKRSAADRISHPMAPPEDALDIAVADALRDADHPTPTHVYLGVVRDYLRRRWDVSDLDIAAIGPALTRRGYEVDRSSGRLARQESSDASTSVGAESYSATGSGTS
jgi:16S rRNA G966 N2-methylase RsmD